MDLILPPIIPFHSYSAFIPLPTNTTKLPSLVGLLTALSRSAPIFSPAGLFTTVVKHSLLWNTSPMVKAGVGMGCNKSFLGVWHTLMLRIKNDRSQCKMEILLLMYAEHDKSLLEDCQDLWRPINLPLLKKGNHQQQFLNLQSLVVLHPLWKQGMQW